MNRQRKRYDFGLGVVDHGPNSMYVIMKRGRFVDAERDHVVLGIIWVACINEIVQKWTGSLYFSGADYFSARFSMQKMANSLICSIRFKLQFTLLLCLARNLLSLNNFFGKNVSTSAGLNKYIIKVHFMKNLIKRIWYRKC